jgi:hypothetical protein
MNELITGIRNALADLVRLLRGDHEKTVASIQETKKAVDNISTTLVKHLNQSASVSAIANVEKAVNRLIKTIADKDNVVSMENVDVITKELRSGLTAVVDALREEVGKMEKQIVVKNDLGQLFGLFKGNKDKGDMIKALARIEDAIDNLELPQAVDYTLILSDIAKAVESKTTKKLEELLTAIGKKDVIFPDAMKVVLEPRLIDDNRIRVVLRDDQVSNIVTAGGANNAPVVDALNKMSSKYALRLVESAPYTYIGKAVTGSLEASAVWQIFRMDETSGLKIEWADGNSSFDNVWSNYSSLNYS